MRNVLPLVKDKFRAARKYLRRASGSTRYFLELYKAVNDRDFYVISVFCIGNVDARRERFATALGNLKIELTEAIEYWERNPRMVRKHTRPAGYMRDLAQRWEKWGDLPEEKLKFFGLDFLPAMAREFGALAKRYNAVLPPS